MLKTSMTLIKAFCNIFTQIIFFNVFRLNDAIYIENNIKLNTKDKNNFNLIINFIFFYLQLIFLFFSDIVLLFVLFFIHIL